MITITEDERRFTFEIFNELYQNWASRSIEPDLLSGILIKLRSVDLDLTPQESRRIQYALQRVAERYCRMADQTIQFILNQQDRGVDKTHDNYFNGSAMLNTSQAILAKLELGS